MMKRNFRSLTVTLALAIMGVSISVLLVGGCTDLYFSMGNEQNSIQKEINMIANDAAKEVEGFFQEKFSVLKTAISTGKLASSDQEGKKVVLDKLLGIEPSFRQIILLNDKGNEMASASKLSSTISGQLLQEDRTDIIYHTSEGNDYIGTVYIDKITNEPIVIMAVPVNDVLGEFSGVLVAEVNLKFMWDMVASLEIGREGLAYVVDREGYLISFGDVSRVLRRENLLYLDEVREFSEMNASANTGEASVSNGILGNAVVSGHVHLENPDWAVIVELPVHEAYENIITEISVIAASIAFSLILAILTGILISRRITKPLINLRNAAVKIGGGNLKTRIEIRSRNEIGELASAFVQMTRDLKKSKDKLEDYSRNLEKKVRERTKELEIKDKKLLSQNVELKRLDKEKDEFISIAAHELKTPLTSIKGFAQLMQDERVMSDKAKRKHYLELVNENTVRLYNLILDLVDSSRLSLGKLSLDVSEVDANRISDDIKENMSMVIKEKGINPAFNIGKDLPTISADPERLMQVIRNLIVNATHFTPKGGTISLNVARKDRFVQFEIKDTGEGIPKDKQRHIFSRFYQADASLTRKVKGSGLGLSICQGLVELMGGKIWFKSTEGKGTTFYFTIPIYKGGAKIGQKDNDSG